MREDALLLYTLKTDYHALTPSLKALRASVAGDLALLPEQIEIHRHTVTGWFNAVYALWMSKAITKELLFLVASPRAAQLWVEFVAPLDKAVREAAHGAGDGRMNPVEKFWTRYAKKELLVPGSADV